MSWQLLPVNYTDAVWLGLKRYNEIANSDGTVSFQDVTVYQNKENSFFGAQDANRMNEALNTIMSMVEDGTDLYEAFQQYFAEQKALFEEEGDATIAAIMATYQTDITDFETEQEAAFNDWFGTLQDQLSGDVAANLQNQINTHASRHAAGGADPVTPSMIGAADNTHASRHAAGGEDEVNDVNLNAYAEKILALTNATTINFDQAPVIHNVISGDTTITSIIATERVGYARSFVLLLEVTASTAPTITFPANVAWADDMEVKAETMHEIVFRQYGNGLKWIASCSSAISLSDLSDNNLLS